MLQSTTIRSYNENIRPKLPSLEHQIRRILRNHPEGMTNKEMAQLLHRDASTVSGIVRPLVVKKKVYEGGERICRVTGNTAKVWKLVNYAPAAPQTVTFPSTPALFPNQSKVASTTNEKTWH